jgi:hypothetical protein
MPRVRAIFKMPMPVERSSLMRSSTRLLVGWRPRRTPFWRACARHNRTASRGTRVVLGAARGRLWEDSRAFSACFGKNRPLKSLVFFADLLFRKQGVFCNLAANSVVNETAPGVSGQGAATICTSPHGHTDPAQSNGAGIEASNGARSPGTRRKCLTARPIRVHRPDKSGHVLVNQLVNHRNQPKNGGLA